VEFQLLGCRSAPMWLRPALGKVFTPWEPAACRPAWSASGVTGLLAAGGFSRPMNTISATRATSETTATPAQSRVRWRRRFSSSRRAAAPLASLPLSGWRPRPPPPCPSCGRALAEPRPGWLLPVGPGLGLRLRVSAIVALRVRRGRRYRVQADSMECRHRPCPPRAVLRV